MAELDADVVVVGSGAGGLAAAVALAHAGKRVLVFEQHYLPGGWCHSFSLGGYRFSPGVHYIGDLGPSGRVRQVFEGLGLGPHLTFYELNPDGYEHVFVQGERFDFPKPKERLIQRLQARFPEESPGISKYFETVCQISHELDDMMDMRGLRDVLALPRRARAVARWGLFTARSLIHRYAKSPRLRAVLAAQSGDHGLPPSLVSAPVHAAVVGHYLNGGYYPKGGGAAIPKALLRELRAWGGQIHVRTPVERVLMHQGRAVGVRLASGQDVRSQYVVSNADPDVTFRKLVGESNLSRRLQRRLAKLQYSVSAVSLFLAVDLDLRAIGLDSGNYWYYAQEDVDALYRLGLSPDTPIPDEVPGFFLTATTLKDPSKKYRGHHTLEAFTFVHYDQYTRWQDSSPELRPDDYQAHKQQLEAAMLRGISRLIPNIQNHVVFSAVGTPLTNQFYVAGTQGNLYGTAKIRSQVGPFGFGVGCEIPGLRLCGASTLGHGVFGAMLSGLQAAKSILRCTDEALLIPHPGPLTVLSAEQPAVPDLRYEEPAVMA